MFQMGRRGTQLHLLALRNVEYEKPLYLRGLQGKVGHN
jgi:hypothetical protein